MHPTPTSRGTPWLGRSALRLLEAALVLVAFTVARAADPGVGTIQGRVFNATSGTYLNAAQVSIAGTALQTMTDDLGYFSLNNVPAGPATVSATYTGAAPVTATVQVGAGQTVRQDLTVSVGNAVAAPTGESVRMDALVVQASKEMSGAAIAINEQRFAPNVKLVVATDEFGDIVDGNVGAFLQFLPGITVDNNGSSEPKVITIRGLPPGSTPILIDGFRLASASESNLSRQVYLADNAINSMSRVEVNLGNTPDQPADAIGGSVNMVPRSALEFSKPQFNYNAYFAIRDGEGALKQTRGPRDQKTYKTRPGASFSYIRPVNEHLGFAFGAAHNDQWGPQLYEGKNWAPTSSGTNQSAALPAGVTAYAAPQTNPFMYRYNPMLGQGFTHRDSMDFAIDYKVSQEDRFKFVIDWGYFDLSFFNRPVNFDVGAVTGPDQYGPTFTHGAPGAGFVSLTTSAGQSWSMRHTSGTTVQPMLSYSHRGSTWRANIGASVSRNTSHYRDTDDGFFQAMEVTAGKNNQTVNNTPNDGVTNPLTTGTPITINFDNITKNNATVSATDLNGAPYDLNNLANYTIRSASSNPRDAVALVSSFKADAQRDFDIGRTRFTLKVGTEVRQERRDIRSDVDGGPGTRTWTFVGADGKPGTADDSAAIIADPLFAGVHEPLGGPAWQMPSPFLLFQLYKAHPEYFVPNTLGSFISNASNSAYIKETIPAVFARTDWHLLHNKLWIVAGARYEWTQDEGQGLRQANNTTVTTLAQAQARYFPRGEQTNTRYGGVYPSINATYNLAEATTFRVAYGRALFRPDYNNIVPGVGLPTSGTGTITLNNVNLKPWTADNYEVSLEHYFKDSAGVISIGAFRRNIKDFFATVTRSVTAEDEALYNIDAAIYGGASISTLVNISDAHIAGMNFNYRQGLTFLPNWARGVQVFANGTIQRVSGPGSVPSSFAAGGSSQTNFTNFINNTFNVGISLSRRHYTVKVQENYRARERGGINNGIAGDYGYTPPQNNVNIYADWRPNPHVGVFFTVRNAANYGANTERYISGVTPDYAKVYSQAFFKPLFIVGVKGQF
jgi:iron complex outermembrane recepter protein